MITKGGGYMEDNVVMRIICNETKAKDFLRRLSILCENNNFQNIPKSFIKLFKTFQKAIDKSLFLAYNNSARCGHLGTII